MADEIASGATDEKEVSLAKTPDETVTRWLREIDASTRHEKDWVERAEKIVDLYKDERKKKDDGTSYRFNILFANTEVLKGALYSQMPTPDIRRRFLDKDPVARIGALVLTRAVSTAMDLYDFDGMMKDAVQDMVLPGRGVSRVKYKPTIAGEGDAAEVVYEAVECCYVPWELFRYSPCKRWDKVRWVAYGELISRDDAIAMFGEDVGKALELKYFPKGMEDNEENAVLKRGLVWTIYNKTERKMLVISDGYKDAPLKEEDDPLRLESFFPSCRPLYAISTTNSLIPTPEYTVYQDHARQLDELNERIAVLTDGLRRYGVYDASIEALSQLSNPTDNKFVPVKDYAQFTEKGGLDLAFQEKDLSNLAKTLAELMIQADTKKAQIYEIVGIADIMRGATDAQETLGAQQIKNQWGNVRIGPRQSDVARFARDNVRLLAEVIAEHFSPQTLAQMTGVEMFFTQQEKAMAMQAMQPVPGMSPPPEDIRTKRPTWEEVMKVLKSDHLRGFRIDIETDSTIRPQADEEQKNRIEAVTAVSTFVEKAAPAVQMGIVPQKLVTELMGFALRSFKVGPQMEEILEEWTGGVDQNQAPSPEVAQLKAKIQELQPLADENQVKQAEIGVKKQEIESKGAELADRQSERQATVLQAQAEGEKEAIRAQEDAAIRAEDQQLKREEMDMRRYELDSKRAADREAREGKEREKQQAEEKEMKVSAIEEALERIEQAQAETKEGLQEIKDTLSDVGNIIVDAIKAPRKRTLVRDPKTGKATHATDEVMH